MATRGSESLEEQPVYLNGVDALTGDPLWDPLSPEQVVVRAMAEFEAAPRALRDEIKNLSDRKLQADFGMDVDHLDDPAEALWGVVLPAEGHASLRQALQPLISHRATQLGHQPKVFEVAPDTSAVQFLRDNGVERGLGVVEKVPYYLLIAGDPRLISFRFQMELNTEYATGRLHFDSSDGYAAYADHLVRYEEAASLPNRREAVFWAPERSIDPSTSRSAPNLVQPLHDQLDPNEFARRLYRGDLDGGAVRPATRDNLRSIMAGPRPPALLFTASHGMGYRRPHPGQAEHQGALMCQEYRWGSAIARDQWYGASDLIEDGADVRGLIHFAFACFGAGTPQHDDYGDPGQPARVIADRPFVAALPREMLARGALAFIGHVDRAWDYSFRGAHPIALPGVITPLEAFQRALRRILRGGTVAHALRDEHDRGVHLSTSLLETIASRRHNAVVSTVTLANLWTERNDARAYVLIGDPAARLRVKMLTRDEAPVVVAGATLVGSPAAAGQPAAEPTARASVPAADPVAGGAPGAGPTASAEARGSGGVSGSPANQPMPAGSPRPEGASAVQSGRARSGPAPALEGGDDPGTGIAFLPPQVTGLDPQVDHDLLVAWRDYIKDGLKQNSIMFQKVLRAFVIPYWLTVAMYSLLFVIGLGGFVIAAVLVAQQKVAFASIFGGLSVVSFLTYFISGPTRSLERNLVFITWLGVIYNTYWSQLMNATDPKTVRQDLEAITASAIKDLNHLTSTHDKQAAQRPGPVGPASRPGLPAPEPGQG
jgi:hypothetical protein